MILHAILKGDLQCFSCVFPFLQYVNAFKRSLKLKGQNPHQQNVLSPTENKAPEIILVRVTHY